MHGGNAVQLLGHIKAIETSGHNFQVRAVIRLHIFLQLH